VAGAKIDFQGGRETNSVLHEVCKNGDLKSVNVILDFFSQNNSAQDSAASEQDFKELFQLKNKYDMTAIDLAKQQSE
jgi:hypothetical protein